MDNSIYGDVNLLVHYNSLNRNIRLVDWIPRKYGTFIHSQRMNPLTCPSLPPARHIFMFPVNANIKKNNLHETLDWYTDCAVDS